MGERYREMEISTATPEMVVVRLYEAAIRHGRAAVEHVDAGRIRERGMAISQALAIVGELRSSLDFERGGEIAHNLSRLYEFVSDRLLDANLQVRKQPIGEALSVLESLHGAWIEIARRPRAALPGA